MHRIPIADSLVAELGWRVREFPGHEIEPGATLLFTNHKGQPHRRNAMGDAWNHIRKQLDLRPAARGWHSLRHTYASWLIEAGLSVKTVRARLGQASATETLEVYSHVRPASDEDTRDAIDTRLRTTTTKPAATINPWRIGQ